MTKFIAWSSSAFGKVRIMVRRPTGIIIAAPIPCKMRAATISDTFIASPQNTEEIVKIEIATANTRRVPYRSAIQPLTGMQTARLRM